VRWWSPIIEPFDSKDRTPFSATCLRRKAKSWKLLKNNTKSIPVADEPDYDSPARPRESGTDPFGVISLIFGSLAVVCMLMGCFTCGITYFAAAPFAAVGAGLAFFGRGNMKVAALVLNLVALVPAVVVFVMLITGSMISANRELWKSNATTQSAPRQPGRR
jgi:hypothetical protein